MSYFRSRRSDFKRPYNPTTFHLPKSWISDDEMRRVLRDATLKVTQAINETMTQMVFHYENAYNIRALRPGKPFTCNCMHKKAWHESTMFTECWFMALDDYATGVVDEMAYERDIANADDDKEHPYFGMNDDSLWADAADICFDQFGSDPGMSMGWFWYWGDAEDGWHFLEEPTTPMRQFFTQLPRIKQRRRPQQHEDFKDGNNVPYQPNPEVEKGVDHVRKQMVRLDKIRNTINKKLPKGHWYRADKLFDPKAYNILDREYGRKNPLGFRTDIPFDGWPDDHTKETNLDDLPDYEVLAFLRSQCHSETEWRKFEIWYAKTQTQMGISPHIFDAAQKFYDLLVEWRQKEVLAFRTKTENIIDVLARNRHGVPTAVLKRAYLDTHWGIAFHKWYVEEHSRTLNGHAFFPNMGERVDADTPPVCEVYIQDGPDAGKRVNS